MHHIKIEKHLFPKNFFYRHSKLVAPDLIGCYLIRNNEKNQIKRELVSLLPINAIDSKMFFYLSSAPDYRRKSLDRSLFLVSNTYQKSWFSYYSALRQRNSSLKRNSPQEAISWNMPLSDAASVIQNERSYFLDKIKVNFFNLVKDGS